MELKRSWPKGNEPAEKNIESWNALKEDYDQFDGITKILRALSLLLETKIIQKPD